MCVLGRDITGLFAAVIDSRPVRTRVRRGNCSVHQLGVWPDRGGRLLVVCYQRGPSDGRLVCGLQLWLLELDP